MTIYTQLQSNDVWRELVWLFPEPDSKTREPYWRYTNRQGKTWLVAVGHRR